MLERVLSHARLIDAMLLHAGPEAGKAVRVRDGTAWYEARTECLGCSDARRCQAWLEAAHPLAPPPEFCRSARLFDHHASADCRTRDLVPSPSKAGPRRGSAKFVTGSEQARRFDLEDADH
jgi:hypothetical protein